MNPHTDNSTARRLDSLVGIETGTVTTVKSHTQGDAIGHHVEVQSDFFEESITAEVPVTQLGDVSLPSEGSKVAIGLRVNERPIVLGSRYGTDDTIPEYEPGTRRIGHQPTDTHVEIQPDGTVLVTNGDQTYGVKLNTSDGTVTLADEGGQGIELTNDGNVHIYGKVKQHTSKTIDDFKPSNP